MAKHAATLATAPQLPQVIIGFCHPDTVDANFTVSLSRLLLGGRGRIANIIAARSGPRIATARNDIVRTFLKTNADWLFMLDTDMVFEPEAFWCLLDAADKDERPIVGALAFIAGGLTAPVRTNMMVWDKDDDGDLVLRSVIGYPDDGLCRVASTGAACLLVHRSALLRIQEKYGTLVHPWFQETTNEKYEWGEDVTFCVRAGQCGIPVYVHTGVEFGHMKKVALGSSDFAPFREPMAEEVGDAAG